MQIEPITAATGASSAGPSTARPVAAQLEQAFLEEMLKYCGPRASDGAFSGGAGEEQFASFLTREHAAALSGRLDLGFAAMLEKRS